MISTARIATKPTNATLTLKEEKEAKIAEFKKIREERGVSPILYNEDLYDYVRLSDIRRLSDACNLRHLKIIAPDGAADYMRKELNEMFDMCHVAIGSLAGFRVGLTEFSSLKNREYCSVLSIF